MEKAGSAEEEAAAAADNAALDLLDANVFEDDHFDEEAFVSEFLGDAVDAF